MYRLLSSFSQLRKSTGLTEICKRSFVNERNDLVIFGDDVIAARKNDVPIVALESTIITHGMPYPDNLKTALRVEQVVRDAVSFNFWSIISTNSHDYNNNKICIMFLGCCTSYNKYYQWENHCWNK